MHSNMKFMLKMKMDLRFTTLFVVVLTNRLFLKCRLSPVSPVNDMEVMSVFLGGSHACASCKRGPATYGFSKIFLRQPILVGPVYGVRQRLTARAAPFVVPAEGKQWKVTDKGTFAQRDRWSRTDWQTKRARKRLRRDGW